MNNKMKNLSKVILVIVSLAIFLSLIYLQIEIKDLSPKSSPTPLPTMNPIATPTLSPTLTPISTPVPVATVTANINATPTLVAPTTSAGEVLIINGTITNNSPNTAYNVGVRAFAIASYEFPFVSPLAAINITVPIASGTYSMKYITAETVVTYPLTTLTPYQSVPINITIIPNASSQEPVLSDVNATLVWSNMP